MNEILQSDPRTRIWKLTISYDGTEFSGWQVQPDERTVQGEIQKALGRIVGESPLPQGSGRTDAGVHALGQVASFHLAAAIPPENLVRALNRTLPAAIRILKAETRPEPFHARHSAIGKTYEYRVFTGEFCPPFLARYVHVCRWPMPLDQLNEAAQFFVGEHDFLSFTATDPDLTARTLALDPAYQPNYKTETAMRTVYSSAWSERQTDDGPLFVYRVRGNGFLHHMVRNLVGTMIDVGRGYTPCNRLPGILAARRRDAAGPTAPAQGLFLHSVEYPEGF